MEVFLAEHPHHPIQLFLVAVLIVDRVAQPASGCFVHRVLIRLIHRSPAAGTGKQTSTRALRRQLGRCILLGLEVLIVADIVQTIIVEQTIESVAVLGVIVGILLSFSLEVEMDGMWPWNRWRRSEPHADS